MKYIIVTFFSGENKGKIILDKGKITVTANKEKIKESIWEIINAWKKRKGLNDTEVFKIIPSVTSYYSRVYFSYIIEEKE
jgi:hypothetical protein